MNDIASSIRDFAYSKVNDTLRKKAEQIYKYLQAEITICMDEQRMNIQNGKQKEIVSMNVILTDLVTIQSSTGQNGGPSYTIVVNLQKLNDLVEDQRNLFVDLFHRATKRLSISGI